MRANIICWYRSPALLWNKYFVCYRQKIIGRWKGLYQGPVLKFYSHTANHMTQFGQVKKAPVMEKHVVPNWLSKMSLWQLLSQGQNLQFLLVCINLSANASCNHSPTSHQPVWEYTFPLGPAVGSQHHLRSLLKVNINHLVLWGIHSSSHRV